MNLRFKPFLGALVFFLAAPSVSAFDLPKEITLKTDFRIWELKPSNLDILGEEQKKDFLGWDVALAPEDLEKSGALIKENTQARVDLEKVKQYLEEKIAPAIARDKTSVTINMTPEGKITFEGTGHYGRRLDVEAAAQMMKYALEHNISFVNLPLLTEDPVVTIKSDKLKSMGIVEFVASGETDYSGSPANRVHNIKTGLAKFEGVLVKPGEEFSFGKIIGPINGSTGYKKELVILGNKTVPEYGGGLCQVSTTAYRAILAAGYPILYRYNHAYQVSYYKPLGLDATFYEGGHDVKFLNDTPNHILMQSFTENGHTYYNFYGTKTHRTVHMIGPYYSNRRPAPPNKIEYSSSLAPGEKQVVGHAVPGINVTWYRQVIYPNEMVTNEKTGKKERKQFLEKIFSNYQARPNYYIVGGSAPAENSEAAPPT